MIDEEVICVPVSQLPEAVKAQVLAGPHFAVTFQGHTMGVYTPISISASQEDEMVAAATAELLKRKREAGFSPEEVLAAVLTKKEDGKNDANEAPNRERYSWPVDEE